MRALAFEYAARNGKKNSFKNGLAGKEWLVNFRKRNSEISLRTPENISLPRVTGFSRESVGKFFNNLYRLLKENTFPPHRIFNADETGIQTVPSKLPKVFAKKGQKHVSKIVGAERGQTVTVLCCMSPTGIFIPPMFVFPRKRMQQCFTENLPCGAKAISHSTGYMTAENFPEFLRHFIVHTRPSKEDPVLLILDNHASHVSLAAVELCRDNYVTMLTIPPHTSHKLQPLDLTFFGSFKQRFYAECDKFQINNPGKVIALGQIGGLVKETILLCENSKIASNGFQKAGIWPYNPDVFTDEDFLPASAFEIIDLAEEQNVFVEPSSILPLPKAKIMRKRKAQSSRILTDDSSQVRSKEAIIDQQKAKPSSSTNCLLSKDAAFDKQNIRAPPSEKNKTVSKAKGKDFIDDTICLYCTDKFENSRPGETWIRCRLCLAWAHNECAGVSKSLIEFICELCM